MKTKRNDINQLAFDFQQVRADFPICETPAEIGATLAAFGIDGKSKTPAVLLAGPPRILGPATNATLESSPGSFHRVILHGEVREGHRHYRRIQFPGATYSNGEPRIQTLNAGCVTPDPF